MFPVPSIEDNDDTRQRSTDGEAPWNYTFGQPCFCLKENDAERSRLYTDSRQAGSDAIMSSIAGPSRLPAYSRSRQPSYYEARAPRSSSIPTWFSPPPPHARSVSVVRSVHRSSSVFSQRSYTSHSYQQDEQIKAELDRKRSESVRKLKSTWEQISEKYGKIQVEDDDEIDIYTGQIVRDRGRIQRMKEERDFGVFLSEDEADAEDENSSFIFDEDEDELGAWDARSGLDRQWASDQEDGPKEPPWTVEDDKDLQEFLRMEQARKETMGEASGSEDEPEVDGKDRRPSPRRHGPKSDTDSNGSHSSLPVRSRRYPISDDSDDELLARTSDAEEGTRVTYVDSSEDEADLPVSEDCSNQRHPPDTGISFLHPCHDRA